MRYLAGAVSLALTFTMLNCAALRSSGSPAPKPTILVERLPDGVEGLELRAGAILLKDGYKFEKQPDAKFIITGGGGTSSGGGCGCKGGSGTCEPKLSGGIIICAAGDGCTKCGLALTSGTRSTEVALFE